MQSDYYRPYWVLDDEGEPRRAEFREWSAWFEVADRHVERTRVGREVEVSTVFLGLDHQWRDGPPILWETMIFGGGFDQWQARATTRADAVRWHMFAVGLASFYRQAPRRLKKSLTKHGHRCGLVEGRRMYRAFRNFDRRMKTLYG